jgi:hypothetical protein
MSKRRLDIWLGDTRATLDEEARRIGVTPSKLAASYIEAALLASSVRQQQTYDLLREALAAVQPDERHDPADDSREAAMLDQLAEHFGSVADARAILSFFRTLAAADADSSAAPEEEQEDEWADFDGLAW